MSQKPRLNPNRLGPMSARKQVVRSLRRARSVGLRAARPLDYVSLALNDKTRYPPIALRRYVGPLGSFETSGAEWIAYLKLLGRLEPRSRLLDVGCGCGLIALQLGPDYFEAAGGYWGVDIHAPSIEWCNKHLAGERYSFQHIDVYSEAYNRTGGLAGGQFTFPYQDSGFDLIALKSVFTHMRPPDVDNYLAEVRRLLDRSGRAVVTFFLLNPSQRDRRHHNQLAFDHGDGIWRYVHPETPESAVAYEEEHILGVLDTHGLELAEPIRYGRWSGRPDGLSFQDLLLIQRR